MRISLVFSALLLLASGSAVASSDTQVLRFCGQQPNVDAAKTAPVKVGERLLARVYATREKVFVSYRREYDTNRQQIINRNKRLPKAQQMPVPAPMSDDELRRTPEFKQRSERAHCGVQDEASAKQKVASEKAILATHEANYQSCKKNIEERISTAATKSAAELNKIPAKQRLSEENQRLAELATIRAAELNAMRQEPTIMTPILSAAICAHQSLIKEITSEVRQIKRDARKSGEDVSAQVSELTEAKQEHDLDIIELRRDVKRMKIRQQRCSSKAITGLVACFTAKIRTPNITPLQCNSEFGDELDLLGYESKK